MRKIGKRLTLLQLWVGFIALLIVFIAPTHAFASPLLERTDIKVGVKYNMLFAGDVNADGKDDLLLYSDIGKGIQLLLGNGDSTFQPAVKIYGGIGEFGTAGDVTGDGLMDLIIKAPTWLSVLVQQEDGTFHSVYTYVIKSTPGDIAIEDLDGDGIKDLALAFNWNNKISFLQGKGDGTFQLAYNYDYTFGIGDDQYPEHLFINDFNKDGIADVLVGSQGGNWWELDPYLTMFTGDGDWTYHISANYSSLSRDISISAIVAADINGDDYMDIVEDYGDSADILINNGDGTFQQQPFSNYNFFAAQFIGDDYDGDGIVDLAGINNDDVAIADGNGDGTFQPSVYYDGIDGNDWGLSYSLVGGDFNEDGRPDLALTYSDHAAISIFTNLPDTAAPLWPEGQILSVTDVTSSDALLHWTPAEDNLAVSGYELYQDDKLLTALSGTTTSYQLTGLAPESTYSYHLVAFDEAGNRSGNSPVLQVTTDRMVPDPTSGSLQLSDSKTYQVALYYGYISSPGQVLSGSWTFPEGDHGKVNVSMISPEGENIDLSLETAGDGHQIPIKTSELPDGTESGAADVPEGYTVSWSIKGHTDQDYSPNKKVLVYVNIQFDNH